MDIDRNEIENTTRGDNPLDSFDLFKFLFTLKKSIVWIALILVLTFTTAFLVVRYTKPLFESSSIIKLDFENEANTLGLVNTNRLQQDLAGISGEIEILRSKLFLRKVAEEIGLPVSVHYYGRYLTDERYKNSPFDVSFKIKNASYYDRRFDLTILDDETFNLEINGWKLNQQKFGKQIETENFNFLIEKRREFNSGDFGKYFFTINSIESWVNYFQQNLTVRPENFNAKTIRISLKDHNKYKASDLLTCVDTLYLDYTKAEKNQALDQKIEFLDKQIKQTEETLEKYESLFENFIIDNRTTSLDGDISETIRQLDLLDSQRFYLQNRFDDLSLLSEQVKKNDFINIDPFTVEQLPEFLRGLLLEYEKQVNEKNDKLSSYNENTPVIRRIDSKLKGLSDDLLDYFEKYSLNLQEGLTENSRKKKILESTFSELPSMNTDFNKNKRIYDLQLARLQSYRQTKIDLEVTKAGTVTDGVLLSSASIPGNAISPKVLLIYGAAGAGSFVLALLLVLVRYLLNNRITSSKELERLTNVPLIGSIPYFTREKIPIARVVVNDTSKSMLSESLRTIRTNMEFLNPGEKAHTLTVTSTVSGEGKTFVAVNLAAIMASTGQKVCVLDLDMRKPKVHLAFEHEPGICGTSTILIGKSNHKECLKDTHIETLKYIPAGPTPPNPSELIMSKGFNELLQDLSKEFDLVICDTPPVGLVTDAILVMRNTDLQMYVVKAEYSRRSFVKTIDNLKHINKFKNLTVVFNGVRRNMHGYGYGYGYGYGGYGYGYGYYEESNKPKNKLVAIINSLF